MFSWFPNSDIEIIRGNTYPPMQWQFLVSEHPDVLWMLDGSIFKLTVSWPGGTPISKSSDVDTTALTIDFENSIVRWNYTINESRLIPLGRLGYYELERWIDGNQQTLVSGAVAARQGSNPD